MRMRLFYNCVVGLISSTMAGPLIYWFYLWYCPVISCSVVAFSIFPNEKKTKTKAWSRDARSFRKIVRRALSAWLRVSLGRDELMETYWFNTLAIIILKGCRGFRTLSILPRHLKVVRPDTLRIWWSVYHIIVRPHRWLILKTYAVFMNLCYFS